MSLHDKCWRSVRSKNCEKFGTSRPGGATAPRDGALLELDHPHIVPIISFSEAPQPLSYVTPFYELGSLREFLRSNHRPSADQLFPGWSNFSLPYMLRMRRASCTRDLKPDNILLEAESHLLIADWGLVYFDDGHTTQIVGTPGFIAPEIQRGSNRAPHRISTLSATYSAKSCRMCMTTTHSQRGSMTA